MIWYHVICSTHKFDANHQRYISFPLCIPRSQYFNPSEMIKQKECYTFQQLHTKFSLLTIHHIIRMEICCCTNGVCINDYWSMRSLHSIPISMQFNPLWLWKLFPTRLRPKTIDFEGKFNAVSECKNEGD